MKQEQNKDMNMNKAFMCIAIIELVIAALGAAGMGVNVIATTNGVANVTLNTDHRVVDHYYADLTMTTKNYHFNGHMGTTGTNNQSATYTYQQGYQDNCGDKEPTKNSTTDCKARYALWKWTAAFTGLGTAAIIIVFVTGVFLFIWGCCAERLMECCCGCGEGMCCSCTTEFVLMVLNFLICILFAFSWAIILAIKFDKNLPHVIDTAANDALNNQKSIETYNFDFEKLKVGKSLGPLAAASALALIVVLYLFVTMCRQCCSKSNKEEDKNKEGKKLKEGSTEMANEEVQV